MKKKLFAGLLILVIFMIPIQVNSFSEYYSIIPLMQEQLQKIEQKSYELYNILIVPDTLYQANGFMIELSIDQKKDLFNVGKAKYLELKDIFDSLQTLIQAFEKDSIF